MMAKKKTYLGPLYIVISSLLWAADALFRVPLLGSYDSGFIVVCEHVIACVILWPFFIRSRKQLLDVSRFDFFCFVFLGLMGSALATLFLTAAYRFTNPSVAILLQKLQPLVCLFAARIILKEALPKKFFYWAPLSLLGALLVSNISFGSSFLGGTQTIGVLLALFATVSWGLSTVFGRHVSLKYDFVTITYLRYFWGAFTLSVLFAIAYHFKTDTFFSSLFGFNSSTFDRAQISLALNPGSILYILYIAFFSGVSAMTLYYKGLQKTSASKAAIFEMFFPLFAVILNWIFLNQPLNRIQIFGGILLIMSSYMIAKQPSHS